VDLDLQQYMGAYIDGAKENLDTMDRMLLAMEQNPGNIEIIEEIFRAAHTLKGMSATMGFEKIAHLTHEMEGVLDKLRSRQISVTPQIIDIIFETFDVLRTLVNDSINQSDSGVDLSGISGKLNSIITGQLPAATPQAAPAAQPAGQPAPAAEPPAAPGGGEASNIAAELAQFNLSEFEQGGLVDAHQRGTPPYLLKVNLVADCLLKGPRIFMVLRTLDSLHCEIFKSVPEVKDLENEKFDRSFTMIVISDHQPKEIGDAIETISEIERTEMHLIPPDLGASGEMPAPEPPPPPPPAAPPPPPQAQAPARPAAPPPPPPPPAAAPPVAAAPKPSPASAPPAPPTQPPSGGDDAPEGDEPQKEVIELVQLVSFQMAGETYALEIKQVEGIINMLPMTRVPKSPPHIEGVINLRGEILPVINLRRRLKQAEKVRTNEDQIIILSFEREKVKVGLLVDRVQEVLRLPQSAIEPPSHVSEGVNVEHLRGVGKMGNRIIILLNAEKIVFG